MTVTATKKIGASEERLLELVDVAVVIVTYNSAKHVGRLLDSLHRAADGLSIRPLVVDNDSQDDTLDVLRSREDVILIEARSNLGYGGGINVGRAAAGPCSSVLILNPDLVLEPGAIARLYEAIHEPGVGAAVPMLLNDDGSVYPALRREPSASRVLGDALFGSRFASRKGWLTETIREPSAYAAPRDVAWAGGAAILISAGCNEAVGDWDEVRFFLYSEETDFCARARQRGFRIRYVPAAQFRHEGGGSGQSPALGALLAVNRVRYFEKYHRRPASSLFRAAVTVQYALRAHRTSERAALRALCRRSSWNDLPGASRPAAPGLHGVDVLDQVVCRCTINLEDS